ncbi:MULTISPECIES: hypothetical protein [Aerococcus]|uniref:DUF5067 domain-containing protein n=1 Tax=Aerococcus mictus TaxID=2976810 RepID=A0A1E9PKK4_9LACT|nr:MULTISPECIES: hypothetical protein [Aerococcus]AEA00443.1 hypothetical protein HMPREF9243_0197 [Aerococcus sp. Group 1]KAA9290380.1 hypothetical protein F6I06_08825 [Aerococcus mictus]MBU5610874.1 hypothetical protein [Aerococcus urinae]MCY3031640.1 hypothetical protein [Aerococcus sp. Group 1]MCY3039751.1 hypothetical protein [Aerococcus sp. Group 2]
MSDKNKNLKKNQFIGEDGKLYESVQVKPWYKKWYVWTIIVLAGLLLLAIVPVDHSNNHPAESSSQAASQDSQGEHPTDSEANKKPISKANEEVILETADGNKASLTIKSASANPDSLPNYMHNSDYFDSSRIVVINFSYKNYDLPKNFVVNTHDLQVYDEEGHALERISKQTGYDEIAPGRSADSQVYFMYADQEHKPQKIQIDYVPMNSTNPSPVATIEVDVEQ